MCEDPGVEHVVERLEGLAATVRRRALGWGWASVGIGDAARVGGALGAGLVVAGLVVVVLGVM